MASLTQLLSEELISLYDRDEVTAFSYAALAGVDLSEKKHYLVKIDVDGRIVLSGYGEPVFGIISRAGPLDFPVTVEFSDKQKCILGGSVTAGSRLQSDSEGRAIPLSTGDAFGIALSNGALNDKIEILFK